METFTLSRKELHRPGLLKALCGGRLTNAQVAAALRITVRQVRRLKRRFEAGGPGALVHGNRDRPSPRRLPPAEDVHGYVTLFRDVFTAHGLPMAVYGDRLNLLVRNDAHWSVEEQLAGTQAPTHVGRILQNLAIGYIAARSPQAKGRIERLWNTLQDRLVSELRLRGIRTVEAAQAYLAEFITDFNQRFGKPPADRQAVWRRPPRDLDLRLGCGYRRVVARDNTVRLGPRVVQLRGARSYARLTVDVRELLDGRVVVLHDEVIRGEAPSPGPTFILKPRRAPSGDRRPRRVGRARPLPQRLPRLAPNTHTGRRPLATHPWRRAQAAAIRLHEARTGRTFSRRSDGGPNH